MTPTPEQAAIIEAAVSTSDNLLVSALAGAAKTSTLVMVATALKKTSTLCLAFNKRIATEMSERLPGNCESMTLNSLGHRVWGQALGKRLVVNTGKNYKILSALIEALPRSEKNEAWGIFSDTLKAVASGKSAGYIPDGHFENAKRLRSDDDFFASLDEEPSALQERLIREATIESIRRAWKGEIDFDDQIFMPTLFPASFPQYPLVLIDEAQDLSPLNHATLRKLAKKRLIAVGDECQSIYGFRGADQDSMAKLRNSFSMQQMILSISFRCPQSVVREAQWRAPHMRWPDWAKPGEVRSLSSWSLEDLPESAVMICRNNAPIFSMAIRLLKAGRYAEIVGNDVGKNLIKTMKKLGHERMSQGEVFAAIDSWTAAKLAKSRSPGRVEDQAECMRVFAEQGNDLRDAITYAEHIMAAKGSLLLMTGHKSKGLEFNDVFILDRHLVRVDKHQQEANLLYVMQTRAKERLTYVESEGFQA